MLMIEDKVLEDLIDVCKTAYAQLEAQGFSPSSDIMIFINEAINNAGVNISKGINGIIAMLPEREGQIIRHRFGFEDGRSHTLEEVGKRFGVTRERIRLYESKAISKLNQNEILDKLIRSRPELKLLRAIIRYEADKKAI